MIGAVLRHASLLERMMSTRLGLTRAKMRDLESDMSIVCDAQDPAKGRGCPCDLKQKAEPREKFDRGMLH